MGAAPGGLLWLEATRNTMAPKSGSVAVAASKSLVDGDPVSLPEGGTPPASTPVDTLGNSHSSCSGVNGGGVAI